jgi:hypothetical protein
LARALRALASAGATFVPLLVRDASRSTVPPDASKARAALLSSSMVAKRCARSRAIARSITASSPSGIEGSTERGLGGVSSSTRISVAPPSPSLYGARPVSIR